MSLNLNKKHDQKLKSTLFKEQYYETRDRR